MSKGQNGNKEVKKPKKAPAKPVNPATATSAPAVAVLDRGRKK
jgi:hypothetical protein